MIVGRRKRRLNPTFLRYLCVAAPLHILLIETYISLDRRNNGKSIYSSNAIKHLHIFQAFTDDAQIIAEMPNLVHAVATLIKCIAFYVVMCALRILVLDVLKVDLGPAVSALLASSHTHFKAPTFQAQGGNWPSEDLGQEKREV